MPQTQYTVTNVMHSHDHDSVQGRQRRNYLPLVDHCCGCVTELKTAAAIIAVLGVVTSPAVSWAFIRHSYVIRVACSVSTNAVRTDVVDIHLKNVLSFGFGANAGLGTSSCLGNLANTPKTEMKTQGAGNAKNETRTSQNQKAEKKSVPVVTSSNDNLIQTIRWIGWILLAADIIFILTSLHFLYSIFKPPAQHAAKRFIISCIIALILSFIHGMIYVGVCISVGGSFPVFEFIFCIIDVIAWSYFLVVVNSYRNHLIFEE